MCLPVVTRHHPQEKHSTFPYNFIGWSRAISLPCYSEGQTQSRISDILPNSVINSWSSGSRLFSFFYIQLFSIHQLNMLGNDSDAPRGSKPSGLPERKKLPRTLQKIIDEADDDDNFYEELCEGT